jgi:hypothetical protein
MATQKLSCKANCKTLIFLIVNETYTYSIKYKVQNRRYWKGWITKTLLFDFIELNEMYACIFAIAQSFVNPHVVCICLLLLVIYHHQGIIALLCMLVCITIQMPREKIEKLWTTWIYLKRCNWKKILMFPQIPFLANLFNERFCNCLWGKIQSQKETSCELTLCWTCWRMCPL